MPRRSRADKCSYCSKEIRYRTYSSCKFATEGKQVNFLQTEDGSTLFVNRQGAVIKGRQVNDGQFGYKVHDCQGVFEDRKKATLVGERS